MYNQRRNRKTENGGFYIEDMKNKVSPLIMLSLWIKKRPIFFNWNVPLLLNLTEELFELKITENILKK